MFWKSKNPMEDESSVNPAGPTPADGLNTTVAYTGKAPPTPPKGGAPTVAYSSAQPVTRPSMASMTPFERFNRARQTMQPGDKMTAYPSGYFISVPHDKPSVTPLNPESGPLLGRFRQWLKNRG